MIDTAILIGLCLLIGLLFKWGFSHLPDERWQFFACMPVKRFNGKEWTGVNFTFYGLIIATAYVFSLVILIVLLGSLSFPVIGITLMLLVIVTVTTPAARFIARWVEKKPSTFTVGGASFVGITAGPWLMELTNATAGKWLDFNLPVMIVLSACSVSYAMGEGLGRLACISFGCCYGRPISQCSGLFRKIVEKVYFIYSGKTKKISYAHGFEGEKIFPIQAVTSIVYCTSSIVGIFLFLKGYYFAAFMETLCTTQLWRYLSEFFRADYRGDSKISAYQIMGLISIVYSIGILFIFPVPELSSPSLIKGISILWNPGIILLFQALWLILFLYLGKSKVTASTLSFHVIKERI